MQFDSWGKMAALYYVKNPKLYMAPMKGFTDHLFRNTFADHFGGFDLAVAPFLASKRGNKIRKKYVKDVLPENNTRLPVIPQILSKTARDFTVLANYLYDLGYRTVNWNLGCPNPAVADKMRGSGMLPYTDMIHEFLDDVIGGIKGSLSIKIRLGWRSRDDIFRLIPVLPVIIKAGKDDIPDKLQQMKQFHEALFEAYSRVLDGPCHVLNKMKGLWRYFALPFKNCNNSMRKIKRTMRPDQYLEQVNLFFETEARLK